MSNAHMKLTLHHLKPGAGFSQAKTSEKEKALQDELNKVDESLQVFCGYFLG